MHQPIRLLILVAFVTFAAILPALFVTQAQAQDKDEDVVIVAIDGLVFEEPNDRSRVLVLDSPDVIRKKVKSAVTDSDPEVRYDREHKAGISNLLEIMAACTGRSTDDLVEEYGSGGYGRFKEAVAEAVIAELAPLRSAYEQLDDAEVARLMQKGALDARTKAEGYQNEIRKLTGLNPI